MIMSKINSSLWFMFYLFLILLITNYFYMDREIKKLILITKETKKYLHPEDYDPLTKLEVEKLIQKINESTGEK